MNIDEFKRRRTQLKAESDPIWHDIDEHRPEEERVIKVLDNAEERQVNR